VITGHRIFGGKLQWDIIFRADILGYGVGKLVKMFELLR